MSKKRLYEIAKEVGVESKVIVAKAQELGLSVKSHSSSVEEADRIIVLNDGKIDGVGTHAELLAANDIYREVYESQVKGADNNESK